MREERPWEEENLLDLRSRTENLLWTVSGDYDLDFQIDELLLRKSRYMAFYHAVRQGAFEKYFDVRAYEHDFAKKVYAGAEPSVLQALAALCIDSAVWKKVQGERKGVENIRRKAFEDTLKKDAGRLSHTDWGYLEACYLRYRLYGEIAEKRVQDLIEMICALEDTWSLEEVCQCLGRVYKSAYEKGFAKEWKGIRRQVKNSDEDAREYTDKEAAEEETAREDEDRPLNIFGGHVDAQDDGKRETPRARVIYLDQESTVRMKEYIEQNYGKSCLTAQEEKSFQSRMCKGVHKDCRLHITEGILHSRLENSAKAEYVKRVREENLRVLQKNQLVVRQNIQTLGNTLRRALLTRTEKETCSSEYGTVCVNKLWNLNRTRNKKLFERTFVRDNTDYAVEILIDSSGSQQGRQSLVALQAYMISEALTLAGISHKVVGFCTFGAYTILNEYRDYEDGRERNQRIFEFYGSANNRDGLAVRAAADSLDKRKEENKILIVLSDGRPNDIIAGSQNPVYGKQKKTGEEKEPYCLEFAVKDTAGEVRKLRNRNIAVLGVFAGEEEDLQAEKKIFGKDFAYIRDISDFANIVGRYLKKQIAE